MNDIKNWPETKQLISEARVEASIQAGLSIREDCEFKIIHLLHLLYDKCLIRHDKRILELDERDIMVSPQLGYYWCKMKRENQALKGK